MKIISQLICKFRGHDFTRWVRNGSTGDGARRCKRCGLLQCGPMKTKYARKRAAQAHDTIQP